MADVTTLLLGISFILFFGFFAEFVFKKTGVPDILFLLLLGFVIGPHVLKYVQPESLAPFAPLFTTFALLFLIFDGAFNIDLASFAKGLGKSLGITLFNFSLSAAIVAAIMLLFRFDLLMSLLTGFILGGVSSAFVIPIIKQLNLKGETYLILTLESALTDVFCIVFALTTIEIIKVQAFSLKVLGTTLASLFAVAGLIGIISGIFWIIIVIKFFRHHRSYMMTIAYVIAVYVLTEFLNGNGAIAVLFLGLVLRNSRQLTLILQGIKNEKEGEEAPVIPSGARGFTVTSAEEEFFYSQISFFLKTFFFVYIGILINLSDKKALFIGILISVVLVFARNASNVLTRAFNEFERKLMASMFARGLAAATIAQIVVLNGFENGPIIASITYIVIGFTIILSSIRVFLAKKYFRA